MVYPSADHRERCTERARATVGISGGSGAPWSGGWPTPRPPRGKPTPTWASRVAEVETNAARTSNRVRISASRSSFCFFVSRTVYLGTRPSSLGRCAKNRKRFFCRPGPRQRSAGSGCRSTRLTRWEAHGPASPTHACSAPVADSYGSGRCHNGRREHLLLFDRYRRELRDIRHRAGHAQQRLI